MKRWKLIFGISFLLILIGCQSQSKQQISPSVDAFAKCLSEKEIKMYGAYWCPHCQAQKDLFGKSFERIEYVECSLPERKGQTQFCRDLGIASYPTWEFSDGTRIEGEASFEELSEKTGCPLNG